MSKIAGELNAEMSKTIGSKEYNEWLNSPLTKALKRSFEQSITDPENQPSQYGTVTLAMYEHLEEQITASQQRVAELEENWRLSEIASAKRQMNVIKLTAERDALKKLYESSEEYVIALKETRNRLAEERDEWRSKHDVACLTITNLQSKYECQLSATSKAMQGVVELTAERDALKQQRDGLLAALERSLESFEYIAKYGNSCGHSQLRIPDLKAVIASVEGET